MLFHVAGPMEPRQEEGQGDQAGLGRRRSGRSPEASVLDGEPKFRLGATGRPSSVDVTGALTDFAFFWRNNGA